MKKVGLGLFILGVIMIIVGVSMKGTQQFRAIQKQKLGISLPFKINTDVRTTSFTQYFGNASYLDIDMDAANVKIITDDSLENAFLVEAYDMPINTEVELDDEKLKISSDSWNLSLFSLSDLNVGTIKIHVPKNHKFKNVEINLNAGNLNVELLNTRSLSLELNAGNLKFNELSVDDLEAEVNAGNMTFSYVIVNKKAELSCNAGNIDLGLAGKADEYRFDIEENLANLTINDSNDVSSYRGSKRIDIECNVGKVNIVTEE